MHVFVLREELDFIDNALRCAFSKKPDGSSALGPTANAPVAARHAENDDDVDEVGYGGQIGSEDDDASRSGVLFQRDSTAWRTFANDNGPYGDEENAYDDSGNRRNEFFT